MPTNDATRTILINEVEKRVLDLSEDEMKVLFNHRRDVRQAEKAPKTRQEGGHQAINTDNSSKKRQQRKRR
jgi:hypothetical protein